MPALTRFPCGSCTGTEEDGQPLGYSERRELLRPQPSVYALAVRRNRVAYTRRDDPPLPCVPLVPPLLCVAALPTPLSASGLAPSPPTKQNRRSATLLWTASRGWRGFLGEELDRCSKGSSSIMHREDVSAVY